MISVGRYHRPRYYITEKIFLYPDFRRRVVSAGIGGENRRSSFPVLHGVRARARENGTREDDPRAVRQTREDTLFASDDKYVAKCTCTCAGPADTPLPSSQCPLTHLWNSCVATHFLPCTRLLQHFTPAVPTEAKLGTPNFRGSLREPTD